MHKADFGLLFCEPRHAALYVGLGWRAFEGDVFVVKPPSSLILDDCRALISKIMIELNSLRAKADVTHHP